MGLMGLMGGCGGVAEARTPPRYTGAFWKLDGRLDGRLDGQLGSQLGGHFSVFRRTQKAAFLTKRACRLAV